MHHIADRSVHRRCTSRVRSAIAHRTSLVWCQSKHGVELQLHGCASIWAIYVVTAAVLQHGLVLLQQAQMVRFRSIPCFQLGCMIDFHRVLTSYVRDSLQIRLVSREVITFTTREALVRDVCGGMQECGVCRELYVERLGSVRSIYRATSVGRRTRVESFAGREKLRSRVLYRPFAPAL